MVENTVRSIPGTISSKSTIKTFLAASQNTGFDFSKVNFSKILGKSLESLPTSDIDVKVQPIETDWSKPMPDMEHLNVAPINLAPSLTTKTPAIPDEDINFFESATGKIITPDMPGSPVMENGEIDPALLPQATVKTAGASGASGETNWLLIAGLAVTGWLLFKNN